MALKLTLMIDGSFAELKTVIDILAQEGHFITIEQMTDRDVGATDRIMDVLREHPDGLTASEIGKMVGRDASACAPLLLGLMRQKFKRVERERITKPNGQQVWKYYALEQDPMEPNGNVDEGSEARKVVTAFEKTKKRRKLPHRGRRAGIEE